MRGELQQKLLTEFPFLRGFYGHGPEIACDDGWFDLIYNLTKEISKCEKSKDFNVLQIKEKFGYLRYYCSWETPEISDIISKYDKLSETTCEHCGKPGEMRVDHGWLKVACDECWNRPLESLDQDQVEKGIL